MAQILGPVSRAGAAAHRRFLRPATVERIFDQQSDGPDLVNGLYVRWGIGYALSDRRTLPWLPAGRIAFWGGWGGSMAFADQAAGVSAAYVMTRQSPHLIGDPHALRLVEALYGAL